MKIDNPVAAPPVRTGGAPLIPHHHQLPPHRWPPAWLAALLVYLLLAGVTTWPLALHLFDRFPGEHPVDAWGHYWNLWWFKRALLAGTSPYHTDLWFAPEGTDLWLHTLAPINSALGLLPTLLASPLFAYNLVVLLNVALAGQATFLLARHVTRHTGAALVAGVAFASSPYLLGHLNVGHLNVAALAWLPFFLVALLRAGEGSWPHIPLAALCLLLTALGEWHTTLFALLAGGVLIAWQVLQVLGRRQRWTVPARMSLAALLGGLLLLPLVLATARAVTAIGQLAELGDRYAEQHSANLLAYLLPQDLHPLWGEQIAAWRAQQLTEIITEDRLSLGWVVLVLALVGLTVQRWRATPLLLLLALGIGLGLGPVLHIGRQTIDLVMPYDLLSALPFMDVSRTPARFSVLALLALVLLAADGLQWLANRLGRGRHPRLVIAGLGCLVLAEFFTAPFPLTTPPDTVVAQRIGDEIEALDPAGTILTLPSRRAEQERLFHQVQHERPIYGGFIPRAPEQPFLANTPGFAELTTARPFADIFAPAADPLAVLSYFHVRYVLVYRGEIADDEPGRRLLRSVQTILRQIEPALVSADATLEAWRVPSVEPPPFFLRSGRGWYPVETSEWLGGRLRWMGETAELSLERSQPGALHITALGFSFDRPRQVEVRADDRPIGVITIRSAPTPIQLQVPTGHGTTRLTFRSLDGTASPSQLSGARDRRQLSIALSQVHLTVAATATPDWSITTP